MTDREFDYNVQFFTKSGFFDVLDSCNSISFTNVGDTQVNVDQIILNPSATPPNPLGDSATIGGNANEVLSRKTIQVIFVQPVGAAPRLQVIQKFYVK